MKPSSSLRRLRRAAAKKGSRPHVLEMRVKKDASVAFCRLHASSSITKIWLVISAMQPRLSWYSRSVGHGTPSRRCTSSSAAKTHCGLLFP